MHCGSTGDTWPSHAASHHGGVARHAATRGENADRGVHALHVLRRRLNTRQDHRVALGFHMHSFVGVEHELAGRCTRRRGQALGEHGHFG